MLLLTLPACLARLVCRLLNCMQSGGPSYKVPLGRRDSASFATREDVLSGLPPPTAAVPALLAVL